MAYVRWLELDGTITNVEELNRAYSAETGDDTPFFDGTIDPAWIEYAHGKTYILAEEHHQAYIDYYNSCYGKPGN